MSTKIHTPGKLSSEAAGKQVFSRTQPSSRQQPSSSKRFFPPNDVIVQRAEELVPLLKAILNFKLGQGSYPEELLEHYPQVKNLNSFGKQITTQMMRSNNRYRGYKVETKTHLLKSSTLFLLATLCASFDYTNTSPLFGSTILDLGCGALSDYLEENKHSDLLRQFLNDRPPVQSEVLQILGARVTGIETRSNSKPDYDYQVAYKHRAMPLSELNQWLNTATDRYDLITCLGLFDRRDFAYLYNSPKELVRVLTQLRRLLAPQGLLYCDAPDLPILAAKRQSNGQLFRQAGLQVVYESQWYILEPLQQL